MTQVLADRKILAVSILAAATTVIAGILHLLMAQSSIFREGGEGVLFLVGGMLQVFWAVPVIKQWGRVWQAIGIGGTIVFTALWFATHTHSLFGGFSGGHVGQGASSGNMSYVGGEQSESGAEHFARGRPRGIASIPQLEFFQIAFIGLYAALAAMISEKQKISGKEQSG